MIGDPADREVQFAVHGVFWQSPPHEDCPTCDRVTALLAARAEKVDALDLERLCQRLIAMSEAYECASLMVGDVEYAAIPGAAWDELVAMAQAALPPLAALRADIDAWRRLTR
jgi:hypothetical protein